MTSTGDDADRQAIEAAIARQFESLNWAPGAPANWAAFAADFHPDAALYPSARPAKLQTVAEFTARMEMLARTDLRSFAEQIVGSDIRIFGNVATAIVVCEMTENGTTINRNVEMMLLVKTGGAWQIVSQAWDAETPARPIPGSLVPARDV